jgi:hypothetical protein
MIARPPIKLVDLMALSGAARNFARTFDSAIFNLTLLIRTERCVNYRGLMDMAWECMNDRYPYDLEIERVLSGLAKHDRNISRSG